MSKKHTARTVLARCTTRSCTRFYAPGIDYATYTICTEYVRASSRLPLLVDISSRMSCVTNRNLVHTYFDRSAVDSNRETKERHPQKHILHFAHAEPHTRRGKGESGRSRRAAISAYNDGRTSNQLVCASSDSRRASGGLVATRANTNPTSRTTRAQQAFYLRNNVRVVA